MWNHGQHQKPYFLLCLRIMESRSIQQAFLSNVRTTWPQKKNQCGFPLPYPSPNSLLFQPAPADGAIALLVYTANKWTVRCVPFLFLLFIELRKGHEEGSSACHGGRWIGHRLIITREFLQLFWQKIISRLKQTVTVCFYASLNVWPNVLELQILDLTQISIMHN